MPNQLLRWLKAEDIVRRRIKHIAQVNESSVAVNQAFVAKVRRDKIYIPASSIVNIEEVNSTGLILLNF